MINVNILGRFTADPQITENPTRCSFTLAADSSYTNRENNQRKAEFFRCTVWGKRAETVAKYFHKGDPIIVWGDFHSDEYVGRDKATHHQLYIENASFEFVPGSRNNGNSAAKDDDDDELLD